MSEVANENNMGNVTVGDHTVPVQKLAGTVGYPNSGVICRTIEEVMDVISHGALDSQISAEDARKVVDYLVKQGKADETDSHDGGKIWTIHSNPDARPPKTPNATKNGKK